jgi:hypothetical protein
LAFSLLTLVWNGAGFLFNSPGGVLLFLLETHIYIPRSRVLDRKGLGVLFLSYFMNNWAFLVVRDGTWLGFFFLDVVYSKSILYDVLLGVELVIGVVFVLEGERLGLGDMLLTIILLS